MCFLCLIDASGLNWFPLLYRLCNLCRFCMYAYLFDAFNYIFGEEFCSIFQILKGVHDIKIFKNSFFRQNSLLLSSLHSQGFLSHEVATPHIAVSTVTSFPTQIRETELCNILRFIFIVRKGNSFRRRRPTFGLILFFVASGIVES